MPLNGTEILVLAAKTMKLSDQEALDYFEKKGAKISRTTYYRTLGRLHIETKKRMYEICKHFKELHMARIDSLRQIEAELWETYNSSKRIVKLATKSTDGVDKAGNKFTTKISEPQIIEIPLEPLEKDKILKSITELQPYISTYEEATAKVMEDSVKLFASEEYINLSDLRI